MKCPIFTGEDSMRAHSVTVEYRVDLQKLYLKIATDVYRIASDLKCPQCGKWETVGPKEIAAYLRTGWPEHCGETMHLITHDEISQRIAYQGA
jgi:hypothetical protein